MTDMYAVPTCPIDASHIAVGSIYQGSVPPTGTAVRSCGFDVLVLAAKEYQPPRSMFTDVLVIKVPLEDADLTTDEWMRASFAAERVARLVAKGSRALITCHAGLNRSGLVSALALHDLVGGPGRSIVNKVRRGRPGALSNPSFVRALLGLR